MQIPGIAAVGPQFRVIIQGDVETANVVNFTYGFDLRVYDISLFLLC
jgi:hypothetical protein